MRIKELIEKHAEDPEKIATLAYVSQLCTRLGHTHFRRWNMSVIVEDENGEFITARNILNKNVIEKGGGLTEQEVSEHYDKESLFGDLNSIALTMEENRKAEYERSRERLLENIRYAVRELHSQVSALNGFDESNAQQLRPEDAKEFMEQVDRVVTETQWTDPVIKGGWIYFRTPHPVVLTDYEPRLNVASRPKNLGWFALGFPIMKYKYFTRVRVMPLKDYYSSYPHPHINGSRFCMGDHADTIAKSESMALTAQCCWEIVSNYNRADYYHSLASCGGDDGLRNKIGPTFEGLFHFPSEGDSEEGENQ